jgi:outer membrane protein insertion porin family
LTALAVAASAEFASAQGQTPAPVQGQAQPPAPAAQGPPAPAQGQAQPQAPLPSQGQTQAQLPTVVSIKVEGQKRYTTQQLIDALGQKVGGKFDGNAIDTGLDTLWKVFKVQGTVREHPVEGGIELVLTVTEMPVDLEPRFIGNVDMDIETLRKWAQLGDRSELYLYQAPRVRQRLLEGYHREGYLFAEVDIVQQGGDTTPGKESVAPDVIFEIREGPQVRVKDVVITGNKSFPDTGMWFWRGGLRKLSSAELGGPWLFNWKGDKYVEDTLQSDLLAMREVYRDQGFLDAVVELESLEFSPDRSGVVIHILIDEGQPYRVSALSIHGFELAPKQPDQPPESEDQEPAYLPAELVFPEEELLKLCQLGPGKRYERSTQRADGAALQKHYGHEGYVSHPSLGDTSWKFLEPDLRFDSAKHEVEVTYRIRQGRKRVIREVIFQGAEYTRDRVLRREVSVLPGQVADMNEITRSLGRIYGTSYFDDTTAEEHREPVFNFVDPKDPEHPELVDIRYEVEEGRVINFQIQAGIDSNVGLFGRISLSMANFDITNWPSSLWAAPSEIYHKEAFHGAGQFLDLRLEPGTQVNGYGIHFTEPDLFGTEFDPYSLNLALDRRREVFRNFTEDWLDRTIKIGRSIDRNLSVSVGYSNKDLVVSDISGPLDGIFQPDGSTIPKAIFDEEGLNHINGGLFDVRYRHVDQRLNPREGIDLRWSNGVYGGPFGGDWDYIRSNLDMDGWWNIGDPENNVLPGFHVKLGAGVADAYGNSEEVPYTERFFSGGSIIGRGFAYHGIGPNQGGVPIGGSTELDGSIEYRIPLYKVVQPGSYHEQEIFRLTFFSDAVILDPESYHLDFNELRWSVGFGFGLSNPIPLIFNFGFPLKSGEGDRKQTFSFRLVNISF